MNAPATSAAIAPAGRIVLTALVPSRTHIQELRRSRFDKKALAELAESIKGLDVLQPIVARPIDGGRFEIVAGERRFLAAKLAGLAHIPATLKPLTDEQVLEIQLVENLQREGLHELEEAEGYEELMKLKKVNADQVAVMVGKSRSYVYARTKLLALCPEARKAFYAGELDASRALLIARIGHHDTQRQALLDITKGAPRFAGSRRDGQPMSYRDAHRHILATYMLKLKAAPFDINDAALLPKAGSCPKCPKRTGNQQDLFGDVKDADVCTDPKCFDDKRQAQFSKAAKELAAKGKNVIYGEAAKKVFTDWDANHEHVRDRMSDRYMPMNGETYVSGRGYVTPRQVLGEDYEPTLVQHPGTGRIVQVVSQQAVAGAVAKGKTKRALKASGPKKPKGPDIDEVLTQRLAKLIHEKAPKAFGKPWMVALAQQVRQNLSTRDLDAVALAWGWKANAFQSSGYSATRKLPADAAKLGERDLVLLMFHMIFAIGQYSRQPVLNLFEINEQKVREQIIEERKQAAKKAREEAKAAKEAKDAKPRPVDKVNAAIDRRAAKVKAKKKPAAKKKGKKK